MIEGLHPFYDERVRDLLDFKIYLDISDDVKFAWKLQVHCDTAIQYTCNSAQSNASCVACHCPGSAVTCQVRQQRDTALHSEGA